MSSVSQLLDLSLSHTVSSVTHQLTHSLFSRLLPSHSPLLFQPLTTSQVTSHLSLRSSQHQQPPRFRLSQAPVLDSWRTDAKGMGFSPQRSKIISSMSDSAHTHCGSVVTQARPTRRRCFKLFLCLTLCLPSLPPKTRYRPPSSSSHPIPSHPIPAHGQHQPTPSFVACPVADLPIRGTHRTCSPL